MANRIIAISNQKGGVGKTTTAINLAQGLSLCGVSVLLVDLDPQGNATQGFGIQLSSIERSVADLIRDKQISVSDVTYGGNGIDIIPSTPHLARVERELVGMTNSELRLSHRLREVKDRYGVILLDTPPTFGPLLNSALNAADSVIVPVDSSFFALMGIKELLVEMEEIRNGTNPSLQILGYLLTMTDHTRIAGDTLDELIGSFGEQVFETRIRRSVRLKESPVLGKTIFHHAPNSSGGEDYLRLAQEVLQRIGLGEAVTSPSLSQVAGGAQ